MKIEVTEAQARRLRQTIRGNGDLKDVDLKLASALDNQARNPMLTANELDAVVDVLQQWTNGLAKLTDARVTLVLEALPKLKAMAKKAGQVAEAKARG